MDYKMLDKLIKIKKYTELNKSYLEVYVFNRKYSKTELLDFNESGLTKLINIINGELKNG